MKVLFAVSSENISEAIIKRYQKEYKEILSYKNVYYFNAILKEIQKDKTYDRIIISEDLEPFSNNNYETIDKFIFEKLDSISDEAQDSNGKETSIILICTDRRQKGNAILVKLFGIGVYNALLGNDRSMEEVCKLINKPRNKKEAKIYYRIDTDDVNYKAENENEVSEVEIQNILAHFKKLGRNTAKYSDSFNNIAVQYNDEQLRIIVNCLPINVKAVLEANCERYQELMATTGGIPSVKNMMASTGAIEGAVKKEFSARSVGQTGNITKPIVIPSAVRNAKNQAQVQRPVIQSATTQNVQATKATPNMASRPVPNVPQSSVVRPQPKAPVQEEIISEEELLDESMLPGFEDEEETIETPVVNKVQAEPARPVVNRVPQATAQPTNTVARPVTPQRPVTSQAQPQEAQAIEQNPSVIARPQTGSIQRPRRPVPGMSRTMPPVQAPVQPQDEGMLPGMEALEEVEEPTIDEGLLPGFEDEENVADSAVLPGMEETEEATLPGIHELDDIEDPTIDESLLPGFEDEEIETEETLPGMENLDELEDLQVDENSVQDSYENNQEEVLERRGRGRPRKTPVEGAVLKPKGKRGRPRKIQENEEIEEDSAMLPGMEELDDFTYDEPEQENMLPGFEDEEVTDSEVLPGMEDAEEVSDEGTMLPGMGFEDEELETEETLPGMEALEEVPEETSNEEVVNNEAYSEEIPEEELTDEDYTDEVSLPGLDDLDDLNAAADADEEYDESYNESDDGMLPGMNFDEDEQSDLLPGIENTQEADNSYDDSLISNLEDEEVTENDDGLLPGMNGFDDNQDDLLQSPEMNSNSGMVESIKPRVDYSMSSLNSLITKDKKIVTFIGTSKNGVSFLVNNLAALFSSLGINTAVLDMTKNKNSYYIYTKNEEELRNIAFNSIEKLQNGYAEGIKVDKNLTVYTALPNDGKDYSNAEPILSTLVQNHSLILIDCDYDTDLTYFASCQEMYLVQSMDILTIQPLTAFLRELKTRGILEPEKIRVVVNKELKVKSLSIKAIIGGLSYYNDPAMSFMTELFNKDMVKACTIPFEDNAYSKYLEGIVNCNISLNGFSKAFLSKLKVLGDMVYPLTSKQTYGKQQMPNYNQNAFSSSMNDTLNKMRKKY